MPEPPIGGIPHLAQTVRAGGDIGRHQGPGGVGAAAVDDLERLVALGIQRCHSQGVDVRHRRRAVLDGRDRRVDVGGRALQLSVHRPGVVVDEAAEPMLGGDPRDRRAESDALHHPVISRRTRRRGRKVLMNLLSENTATRGGGLSARVGGSHASPARQ
jgi:hypothetical protein